MPDPPRSRLAKGGSTGRALPNGNVYSGAMVWHQDNHLNGLWRSRLRRVLALVDWREFVFVARILVGFIFILCLTFFALIKSDFTFFRLRFGRFQR